MRRHGAPRLYGLTCIAVKDAPGKLQAVVLAVPRKNPLLQFVKPCRCAGFVQVEILGNLPDKNRAAVALCHYPPAYAAPEGCMVQ